MTIEAKDNAIAPGAEASFEQEIELPYPGTKAADADEAGSSGKNTSSSVDEEGGEKKCCITLRFEGNQEAQGYTFVSAVR